MAHAITTEKLSAMTVEQRETLYRNCMERIENPDAVEIVEMIRASGLPFRRSKEIAHGDPEMRAIEWIINDPDNEDLLVTTALAGEPPLARIEPLIVEKLGSDYRADNGGTIAAGYEIAKRLYALGFKKGRPKPMPIGSVAKTASTFLR